MILELIFFVNLITPPTCPRRLLDQRSIPEGAVRSDETYKHGILHIKEYFAPKALEIHRPIDISNPADDDVRQNLFAVPTLGPIEISKRRLGTMIEICKLADQIKIANAKHLAILEPHA